MAKKGNRVQVDFRIAPSTKQAECPACRAIYNYQKQKKYQLKGWR